jgi:site-specific recombinase XerD
MDPLSTSNTGSHSDPKSPTDLFKQFLNERRFLKNVTPATLEWYDTAWKAFQRSQGGDSLNLSKSALQTFVVSLRERGVKPVSCNTYIKALNAFCLWAHTEGHVQARVQLQPLKVERSAFSNS